MCDLFEYCVHVYVVPFVWASSGKRGGKAPNHLAIITSNGAQAECLINCIGKLDGISKVTLIGRHFDKLALKGSTRVGMSRRGAYPKTMLRDGAEDVAPYDLLVSFEDLFSLAGVDSRCIGFTQMAHYPCHHNALVERQLLRALSDFAPSKQNYGR